MQASHFGYIHQKGMHFRSWLYFSILSSLLLRGEAGTGGVTAELTVGKDAPSAANAIGEDFYKIILREEPFRSTKVNAPPFMNSPLKIQTEIHFHQH